MNEDKTNNRIAQDARIFKNVRIVNCVIGSRAVIGDDSDIVDSQMMEKTEFGRRNLIRNTRIEKGSYTGTNTIIKNTKIGCYCSIGWNVSIGGGNHDYRAVSMYTDYWFKRVLDIDPVQEDCSLETTIGNDVWIGAGGNIRGGVTIGNGAVIGAGCVVVKDIEPYAIVVGVPGRVIKKRFDDETIELLQAIRWWDWPEEKIVSNAELLRGHPDKEKLRQLLR